VRITAALIPLILLLGSPAFASFRCPARGGAQWREYRSAHFLIDTDARIEHVESMVQRLEQMRALVLQALVGEQVEIPGRLRVLVFADESDFRDMVSDPNTAGYFRLGSFGEPTVVVPKNSLSSDPELGAHEIAHYLSYYLFPVQPRWFAEGLAEWVQTVAARRELPSAPTGSHFRRGAGAAFGNMAGALQPLLARYIQTGTPALPAKDLLTWSGTETETYAGRGHAWSWLLYHWLWNERGKAFSEYQKRLGDSGDPDGSWRGVFPEFDPNKPEAMAALEKELDRYRFSGTFRAFPVQAESDGRFSEGPISSSDLHLLILGARSRWPSDKGEREALRNSILDEAFAEDPGNPAVISQRTEKLDPVAFANAVRARPADYRGWYVLGTIAPPAEKEAAFRKAVEANPASGRALNNLAWLLVTSGRAQEALPFANRALDLAPWEPSYVDTLAEVALRLGKCAEALQLERRAVASGPSESFRKRQAEIEQRCRGAAK